VLTETEAALVEVLILEQGIRNLQLLPLICQRGDQTLVDAIKQAHFMPGGDVNRAFKRAKELIGSAVAAPIALRSGSVIGPFQLKQSVGEGPSGSLWNALVHGQPTLVRLLPPSGEGDPERVQRFVERSNAGLPPPAPNLLQIDDAGEDEGWLFASTVGGNGQSLARALTTSAPLPESSAIKCALGIVDALVVAHGLGVVHGGLSPLSVLIDSQGQVKLTDFGVSAAILDAPPATSRPGRRAGLLLYASPDLVAGDVGRGLQGTDDLYALGSLIYHMVTPAHANPAKDKPWPLEPPVSSGLRLIIARLLAGQYGKIEQVHADFARLLQGMPPADTPDDVACIQGRRYPTASSHMQAAPPPARQTGRPLADTASEMDALPLEESLPPAEDVEPERTASGRVKKGKSSRLKGPKSERLKKKGRVSDRLKKGKASERLKARRSGMGNVEKSPGHGFGVFAAAVLLVVGAGAGVWISQGGGQDPTGPLERALGAALSQPPDYVAAWEALEPSLDQPDTAAEAWRLAGLLHRSAAEEREAAQGDPERLKALRDRLGRAPLAARIELDLAPDTWERDKFTDLAQRLFERGEAAAAVEAYARADVSPPKHFVWASEQAFLPELLDPEDGKPIPAGYLGAREVSRAEFRAWAAEAKAKVPSDWELKDDALPATGVTHEDALAYARSLGGNGTLPTLAVFRAAVAGGRDRRYPWGELAPTPLLVNAERGHDGLLPSGALVAGGSAQGAYDLLGNAAEHTAAGELSWGGDSSSDYATLLEPQPAGADVGFRVWLPLDAPKALAGNK